MLCSSPFVLNRKRSGPCRLLRTLRHNAGNGHTCLPRAQLLETASNFIHQPPEKLALSLIHISTGQRPAA